MNDFSILIAQWKSAGSCLMNANSLCGNPKLKLVEMVTMGGKSHFLFRGEESAVTEAYEKIHGQSDCESVKAFLAFGEKILEIYYSLAANPVRKNMTVVEGPFLPDLFQVLCFAIENNFDVVDFHWPRSSVGKGCCLLTSAQSVPNLEHLKSELNIEVSFIDSIASDFENYFDLTAP
jgi:hypothetical protein